MFILITLLFIRFYYATSFICTSQHSNIINRFLRDYANNSSANKFKFGYNGSENNNFRMNNSVVFIIGPTATGKTNVSISLSLKLRELGITAELVNCDSMQVYKNYPIGTDLPKKDDLDIVTHHLFNMIDVNEIYNVNKYAKDAINKINKLHELNILPIVVGGSNMYVESLLWPSFLNKTFNINFNDDAYDDYETNVLYSKLKVVDEQRANQLHKNDRKRIIRSLLLWDYMGIKHSDVLDDEKNKDNTLYNSLIFYTDCDPVIHTERIFNRINYMLKNGIIDEAVRLYSIYDKISHNDRRQGIFQSIAYKEIFPFIQRNEDLKSQIVIDKIRDILFSKTKNYSKKQNTWIKSRFQAKGLNIVKIDTTDPQQINTQINFASDMVIDLLNKTN